MKNYYFEVTGIRKTDGERIVRTYTKRDLESLHPESTFTLGTINIEQIFRIKKFLQPKLMRITASVCYYKSLTNLFPTNYRMIANLKQFSATKRYIHHAFKILKTLEEGCESTVDGKVAVKFGVNAIPITFLPIFIKNISISSQYIDFKLIKQSKGQSCGLLYEVIKPYMNQPVLKHFLTFNSDTGAIKTPNVFDFLNKVTDHLDGRDVQPTFNILLRPDQKDNILSILKNLIPNTLLKSAKTLTRMNNSQLFQPIPESTTNAIAALINTEFDLQDQLVSKFLTDTVQLDYIQPLLFKNTTFHDREVIYQEFELRVISEDGDFYTDPYNVILKGRL